jgi:phospholipase C
MSGLRGCAIACCLSSIAIVLSGCGGGSSTGSGNSGSGSSSAFQLSVQASGVGQGMINSNPAGINCGQTCSANFSSGSVITLTASPTANSFFAGWSGACSGTGVCNVTLTQNTSVKAEFSASPVLAVTLSGTGQGSVSSSPAGIVCGSTCKADFDPGTQVTLTATAAANSTFAGWTGACTGGSPSCMVTLSASEQVTAIFNTIIVQNTDVLSVSLAGTGTGTVTSSPAGISCAPTCSANFNAGTQVTLTATPRTNSSFVAWGGACAGSNPTCLVTLTANSQVTATFNVNQTVPTLTVSLAGSGTGVVASNPAGINCPPTCSASFNSGTSVTLTETPGTSSGFAGWGGACSGFSSTCVLTLTANEQASATFNISNLSAINHIIYMAQENRSFDTYFGALRAYWAANNIPDQSLDGLPQFNPVSGQPPLYGPPPVNPGCDPAYTNTCKIDSNSPPIQSFKFLTECIENPGDAWSQSLKDRNQADPLSGTATLDGYVWGAALYAGFKSYYDTGGIRAMGYYDWTDLNYYYFMATAFATSDRWFSPVMDSTPVNRNYLDAATSQGHVHPIPTSKPPLSAMPIFEALQNAGITWKIYVNPEGSSCTGPPYVPACLLTLSSIQTFEWGQTIPNKYPNNIVPISQYYTDLQNGTLPQVGEIEEASDAGLDEHPSVYDNSPTNIQLGASYTSSLINGLMGSTSWQDSVFILTYDEFGGPYDHVAPQPAVSPDGIKPLDLLANDVCYPPQQGPVCDFVFTGFRMPLIVVSPFTKQNYVSHTVADTTAILKLIETRFNLPPLTNRDAAQMDMTEFFDFTNPPWMTPPKPPVQATNGPCYVNKLP